MEVIRKVGEPVALRLSLNRDETTKFVKAFLTSASGASIVNLNLTHLANGIYGENSYLMPNYDSVDVKYRVYIDSGYTVLDPTYPSAFDVIRKYEGTEILPIGADFVGYIGEVEEFVCS
jgi:hypothetical protein